MDGLGGFLIQDHAELERLIGELAEAVEAANAPELQRAWAEFEAHLTRHFETEENHILPLLEPKHPEETRIVREEHDRIRALIASLGVRADLHLLRKNVTDQLIDTLRRHASYEEHTVYRWLDEIQPSERARCLRILANSERAANARRHRHG
jgi:hemerythrin-like domain-containing protein